MLSIHAQVTAPARQWLLSSTFIYLGVFFAYTCISIVKLGYQSFSFTQLSPTVASKFRLTMAVILQAGDPVSRRQTRIDLSGRRNAYISPIPLGCFVAAPAASLLTLLGVLHKIPGSFVLSHLMLWGIRGVKESWSTFYILCSRFLMFVGSLSSIKWYS